MTVRVLLADDHPLVGMAMDVLLANSDYRLVGKAASCAEAAALARDLDPDLVLLDVDMPDGSGLDLLAAWRGERKRAKVVLLTAGMTPAQFANADRLAPEGVLSKVSPPEDLFACLTEVMAGERWVDPRFRGKLDSAADLAAGLSGLTVRERELVALVGEGLRNRDIADRLKITEGTVKAYLHAIFDKTGVRSRTELALRAIESGLAGPARSGD